MENILDNKSQAQNKESLKMDIDSLSAKLDDLYNVRQSDNVRTEIAKLENSKKILELELKKLCISNLGFSTNETIQAIESINDCLSFYRSLN